MEKSDWDWIQQERAHATLGSTWPPWGEKGSISPHTCNLFAAYCLRSSGLEIEGKFPKEQVKGIASDFLWGKGNSGRDRQGAEICYVS